MLRFFSFLTSFVLRLSSVSSHRSPERPPPKHSFPFTRCAWFPCPVPTFPLWTSISYTRLPQTPSLLFYRTAQAFLLYPPQLLLYEHCLVCASGLHVFKRRHPMYYFFNLNLLCSPWISLSRRTTLECTLLCKPSTLNSS